VFLGKNSVVLAFGDSLTQGVGTSKQQSYPSVLQQKLGIRVINRGVSGETSAQGLARLEQSLVTLRPALVILCFGGNDMLRRLPEQQMRENLARMIEMAQHYQAEVLLLGVPEPSLILSPSPVYEELAERYQLVADLESLSELLRQPSMKSDAIHLNAKGYAALADALTEKIQIQ
jgi:lysophospholipase L1-like esterase